MNIPPDFKNTKLMTCLTYTLDDEIEGPFEVGSDGSVILKEEDEIVASSLFLRTLRVVVDPLGTVIQLLCLAEAEVTSKFCRRRTSRTRSLLWKRGHLKITKSKPETGEVIEVFESL
ncbi:hypothetical protein F2Q70_00040667 [Brassica cretica]|uniref:Uncharacterized protein n=1 Tax=Brassica cretica TaxID=69181 RepID=A0A8S9K7C4_BRACR|nr:hypothetical protein F2Q70_00040667 [Brassica cretica]